MAHEVKQHDAARGGSRNFLKLRQRSESNTVTGMSSSEKSRLVRGNVLSAKAGSVTEETKRWERFSFKLCQEGQRPYRFSVWFSLRFCFFLS